MSTPFPSTEQRIATGQSQNRLCDFVSLRWYEETTTFLFTFIAKTSEILLAADLVTFTADLLTDRKVMGTTSGTANVWA